MRPEPLKVRALETLDTCRCRAYVKGKTFTEGERLEWPLLHEKLQRVLPRLPYTIAPCDWGKQDIRRDAEGHTWLLHHLEVKERLSMRPSAPIFSDFQVRVVIVGEGATRMSDAFDSILNILDQLPTDWAHQDRLPIHAEHLPAFVDKCSMCGLSRGG